MNVCGICQDPITESTFATTLGCGHTFCTSCILPWLFRVPTCPMCRQTVPLVVSGRRLARAVVRRPSPRQVVYVVFLLMLFINAAAVYLPATATFLSQITPMIFAMGVAELVLRRFE